MSIQSGTRIGAYEVRSQLGEGAMGVVFRAHDRKLQRDVALKVLPDHFATDPDRLGRFQREAQLLASLNHQNIAHIYGLEQFGDSGCIVMELVEGQTLGERIKRGAIPIDEAFEIAKQIAEALEAAHERGIVHRDLKPANIKLTPDGKVKVLDFGLAKAFADESTPADVSNSPTVSSGSMAGAIVGSPGYMAPEQARGRPVDKRADIWAFGCVLYEMVTGTRAFDGEDISEALGAIIHKEPAWERVPPAVLPLLRRCLEKDPKRRLRDIGDAMVLVEQAPTAAIPVKSKPWVTWVAVAVSVVLASLLALSYFRATPAGDSEVVRFPVPPPEKTYFDTYIAISPDGRRLAFTAVILGSGVPHLWIRDIDKIEARMLPGTEYASSPFWSADSRFIAYSVASEIKKVDPAGGAPQRLSKSDGTIGSGTWSSGDVVLFGHRAAGPLLKVAGAGGVPTPVTALNPQRGDVSHAFPSFLPDGRRFIYSVNTNKPEANGVYVGSLDVEPEAQSATRLLETQSRAVFVPSSDRSTGQIVYLRDGNLMTQAFDISGLSLRGEPTIVAERIEIVNNVYGVFSASTNGVLAYRATKPALALAVWVDRDGRQTPAIDTPLERTRYPALSPDGKRLALIQSGALWVHDLEGRPPIKLTSEGAPASPIWTRDGKRIIFEPNTPELESRLVSLPADGSVTKPEVVTPEGHLHPLAWTPDGNALIASLVGGENGDVVKFATRPDSMLESIVQTPAQEGALGAALSPDGRWLAYTSNTTGNTEVWVRPYGREGAPVRITPNGGAEPLWSKDGRELYYRIGATKIMAVSVDIRTNFVFKPAVVLFEGLFFPMPQPPTYALAPDGRFLVLRPVDPTPSPITITVNWLPKLPAR
jgi:Tol biopolymer transport system component